MCLLFIATGKYFKDGQKMELSDNDDVQIDG